LEEIGRFLILRYYPGIRLEIFMKKIKYLSQDSRYWGRDLNLGPLKYKVEGLKINYDVRYELVVTTNKLTNNFSRLITSGLRSIVTRGSPLNHVDLMHNTTIVWPESGK
jgi:hypothetical protein